MVETMANRTLLKGVATHEFGIVSINNTYGTVLSCDVTEKVDEYIFEDKVGDAAAVLLHNHMLEVEFEVLFNSAATALAIGTQVDIPGGALKGSVVSIKDSRKNKDGRKITFTAKHWKALGNATAEEI